MVTGRLGPEDRASDTVPPGRLTGESSCTYSCHLLSAEKEAAGTLGEKTAAAPACGGSRRQSPVTLPFPTGLGTLSFLRCSPVGALEITGQKVLETGQLLFCLLSMPFLI